MIDKIANQIGKERLARKRMCKATNEPEGKTVIEKGDILDGWHSYGKELFKTDETKMESYHNSFKPETELLFK